MITIDLHGYKIKEAIDVFNGLLNMVRVKNETQIYHFITGQGPIQDNLIILAKEYDLECSKMISNPGILMVYFE